MIYTFSSPPNLAHVTVVKYEDVLNFYLTLDELITIGLLRFGCRVLSLSDCIYRLYPLNQTGLTK